MGTWIQQLYTQVPPLTDNINIPATSGKYNSVPYYIGLLKNGELNTINISDLTIISMPDWVKDASFNDNDKRQNGDYYLYPLRYEVDENTDKSEREGIISIKHDAANKIINYYIKQSGNTTQEPTEPTLNEYVFQITDYTNSSNKNYVLQVCGHSADPKNNVPFATIKSNDIKQLSIDIKIDLLSTNSWDELDFNFTIIGKDFKFDSSIKQNDGTTRWKVVNIMLGAEKKGVLRVECSDNGGLKIRITIFSNNQNPKALALLSEDIISEDINTGVLSDSIEGTITINSHEIPFVVTFGFGNTIK